MNDTNATPSPAIGFAVASLTLGIIAVFGSFLLIGAVAGLLGLIFGWIQLARRDGGRGMARWGVGLSLVGLLLGGGFAALYYRSYQEIQALRAGGDADGQAMNAWIGVAAPDLEVTALDGTVYRLSELKGRRVVLDFWATWCPPCRKEIPHFVELSRQHPEDQLLIVGISNEDAATLRAFAEKNGMNYPVASHPDAALVPPYSLVRAIPTTFFVDRRGIIQSIEVGYKDLASLTALALADDVAGDPKPAPM